MIKLCSLGDFLSFEDLLKKLTSLEKRLVSSVWDDGQPDSERLSDPGVVWTQGDRKSEVKETAGHDRDDKSWDDFLAFLSTKSKAAYSILKEWQVLKLTGETLEIESGNQSFSSTYFDDKERYNQLINYCREFFQKDLQVKITVNHHAPDRTQKEPTEKVLRREAPKNSKLPQTAQEILNLFEGQIMKENPIKTGKNSSKKHRKKRGGKQMKGMPNMGQIMKQAQKFQTKMAKLQEELSDKTVEASAGGGMVTVVANGGQDVLSIRIDPEVVDPDDVEMLQDLIMAAVNDALSKAKAMMNEEMGQLTKGMNIPGMPGML